MYIIIMYIIYYVNMYIIIICTNIYIYIYICGKINLLLQVILLKSNNLFCNLTHFLHTIIKFDEYDFNIRKYFHLLITYFSERRNFVLSDFSSYALLLLLRNGK